MKIEAASLSVKRSGGIEEKNFGIASNAKAFDILSSKIYTDIPLAIVRELSTNASDSHVDAGSPDKQFDVHLPNFLEPWLTIRDYGTGLSPEDVQNVYTTYFKSTRSTSDNFTGCLGLGSKSPFAYTDQFTIVANWHGKQYTYSAFKNESDCPTLARLGETDTQEHNGLEIRIPIKPGDFHKFIEAAQKIYQHFKMRPNIVGATLKFDERVPEMTGSNFVLHATDRYGGSKLKIVMGQVCYHADINQFNQTDLGTSAELVLDMPMGSCSISASREEIHYDKKTIDNVRVAISAATAAVKAELETRVVSEQYLLAKMAKISKYRNLVTGLTVAGMSAIPSNETNAYSMKECSMRRGDKLYFYGYHRDFSGATYTEDDEKYVFIHEDVTTVTQNMKNRIRQFMRANQSNYDKRFLLVKIANMALFTERFGPPIAMSSLPDVPKIANPTQPRTARSKPIKLLRNGYARNMAFAWENTTSIDTTDACCVRRDGNYILSDGKKLSPDIVVEIAKALGYTKIYGISDKRYDSLRVKYNLPELMDGVKNKIQKLVDSLDQYALANFLYRRGMRTMSTDIFEDPAMVGLSTECDDFIKMIASETILCQQYAKLCEYLDIKMPTATNYSDAFFKKYPILLAIDWYSGNIQIKDLINYIKLCN